MRIFDVIDAVSEWPLFAISITKHNKRKMVRVCGVLLFAVTFLPLTLFWAVAACVLWIPAMIQDA